MPKPEYFHCVTHQIHGTKILMLKITLLVEKDHYSFDSSIFKDVVVICSFLE